MGVAASSLPPETRARYIPPEIVEEILLLLPFKSLVRFSTVSKAWHSIIFDAKFAQRHSSSRRRRLMIAAIPSSSNREGTVASTRPLSSITSDGERLIFPFRGQLDEYYFRHLASCGDLWCIEYSLSLFLWNPSMRTFRKLPNPPPIPPYQYIVSDSFCCFGVGYDSVADDYKILRFKLGVPSGHVYSLRSDTWKETEAFPGGLIVRQRGEGGVAASGALHWLARAHLDERIVIVSFDLLRDKYEDVPMLPHGHGGYSDAVLSVVRGKLCVALKYGGGIGIYLMQEYGVGESWAKIYHFEYPYSANFSRYETGLIALIGFSSDEKTLICADEDDEFRDFRCLDGYCCHLYLESLISPETYCGRLQTPVHRRTCDLVMVLFCFVLGIVFTIVPILIRNWP